MKRIILYPYQLYSESADDLANEVGATKVRRDGNYRPKNNDLIVNWGNSHIPNWIDKAIEMGCSILNNPLAVKRASDKLATLRTLKNAGVSTVEFTTSTEEALEYPVVVARTILNGNSGEGIRIINTDSLDRLPEAPLYTKFIPQKAEYRVHVFKDNVISYAKKEREDGDTPTEEQSMVRSHNNGWIFRRKGLRRLERVESIARVAINALGLDFGGVDVVMDMEGNVHILEVNTAIGMEGATLEAYKNAIIDYATN